MSTSGRSSFSCIRMTLAVLPFLSRKRSGSFAIAADNFASAAALSSGLRTRYLTILLSIFIAYSPESLQSLADGRAGRSPRRNQRSSQLPVVAFLNGVKQIGGSVFLTVVLN